MATRTLKPSTKELAAAVPAAPVNLGKGGARPRAGRPKGSKTGPKEIVVPKAAQNGLTPLHVLLEGMRYWHNQYRSHKKTARPPAGSKPRSRVVQEFEKRQRFAAEAIDRAMRAADLAAPYIHARLSATANFGAGTGGETPESLKQARKTLEERFEGLAKAAGNDDAEGPQPVPGKPH